MTWSDPGDRTSMLPRHIGRNVFPCTVSSLVYKGRKVFLTGHGQPLFNKLIRFTHVLPNKVCIRDVRASLEKTHLDLLSDVLALREHIKNTLQQPVLDSLDDGDEVYIAVVAPGGYEYAVAVLAVLAIGAAVVPLTTALPVDEATYFIQKCKAPAILAASSSLTLGRGLEMKIRNLSDPAFRCVPIHPIIRSHPLSATDIFISSDLYLDDNAPGVVIFTSGTTGPPKGAVMRRAFVHDCAASIVEHFDIKPSDVVLHVLPVHHATGVGIVFFPFLLAGACIEFRSGSFDEKWMWERWKVGAMDASQGLTFFCGVPTIYMRMKRYFQRELRRLPQTQIDRYIDGARQFRYCLCGTSALPRPVDQFWADLMQQRIIQRYGATEIGAAIKVDPRRANEVPDGSVGERFAGVDMKLSEGDEGEILVRSPYMFSKYLYDPKATADAHNVEGYFRTGDLAKRVGKYYWILGRASLDIIKSGGYKISALDIERELLSLPYISEALVVGVPDEEFGQRVGAIVTLQEEELTPSFRASHSKAHHILSIDSLRQDLRSRLAGYKLPTLLRIVEGELPKTATGKVQKKILGPLYFPSNMVSVKEVQAWTNVRQPRMSRL